MAQDHTYYLDEGLFISAEAPSAAEINFFGDGGGGPGSGGWGLGEGPPRGTSPTKHDAARVITLRRVLNEEYQVLSKQYEEEYAPQVAQLPQAIAELKSQAAMDAQSNTGVSALQQAITSRISQIREGYLQVLPNAHSYYGVPAFYKRGDSMMSRLLEPGVLQKKEKR